MLVVVDTNINSLNTNANMYIQDVIAVGQIRWANAQKRWCNSRGTRKNRLFSVVVQSAGSRTHTRLSEKKKHFTPDVMLNESCEYPAAVVAGWLDV